jgi:hypothetical protein
MGDEGKRCDHPRLVKIAVEGAALPMFGNVFKCEECNVLVEVVIGRTITTQQLRDFADAIESGKAKPSLPPEPMPIEDDDVIEVEGEDDTWGGADGSG